MRETMARFVCGRSKVSVLLKRTLASFLEASVTLMELWLLYHSTVFSGIGRVISAIVVSPLFHYSEITAVAEGLWVIVAQLHHLLPLLSIG